MTATHTLHDIKQYANLNLHQRLELDTNISKLTIWRDFMFILGWDEIIIILRVISWDGALKYRIVAE